jgi:hypothetical protein
MIGQITGQMKPVPPPAVDIWEQRADAGFRRKEIMHAIDELHILSRRSLWKMLLFLAISAVALQYRDFNLFAVIPDHIQEILGAPLSPDLIHIVLAVSTISSLVTIAGRIPCDARVGFGWLQLGMSAFYYPLYAAANALNDFLPTVFTAGLIVLLFEHVTTWSQTSQAIREEQVRLGKMA